MRRNQNWAAPIAAGVMGFAFAFGGVYLNAKSGSTVEAKPTTAAAAEDPVVLLQRALLADSASIAEAEERLRRLMAVEVPPVPVAADAPHTNAGALVMLANVGTFEDRNNARRDRKPGPGRREDVRGDR